MLNARAAIMLVLITLVLPSTVLACLWDYDTLLQERSRFPDTLELITGKFLRHSKEFYEWRIRDRLERLKNEPDNLALYDDLAVAYDKTRQQQKAIETMLAKDQKKPGLYETEANLGTFYIHSGQFEKGLEHIDRALQINSHAHFGREKYQRFLVEYVLSRRKDGKLSLPLSGPVLPPRVGGAFMLFLQEKNEKKLLPVSERQKAIKGVLGMMRFGHHDSPVLLEVLGNILGSTDDYPMLDDAKLLAARAYLKVSYEVKDENAQRLYRRMAEAVMQFQAQKPGSTTQLRLEELEASFKEELAEAQEWYAGVRQDEMSWILEGKNPDQEFTRKYYAEPQVSTDPSEELSAAADPARTVALVAGGSVFAALVVLVGWRRWRRASAKRQASNLNSTAS